MEKTSERTLREGVDIMEPTHIPTASAHESHAQRRQEFIQSLRACAEFLESHPDVIAPRYITMNVFVNTRAEVEAQAKAGGQWQKVYNGEWFYLSRAFGVDLSLDITVEREVVCEKVVTGTRVIPAQPERTVEEVEWVCSDVALLEPLAARQG